MMTMAALMVTTAVLLSGCTKSQHSAVGTSAQDTKASAADGSQELPTESIGHQAGTYRAPGESAPPVVPGNVQNGDVAAPGMQPIDRPAAGPLPTQAPAPEPAPPR